MHNPYLMQAFITSQPSREKVSSRRLPHRLDIVLQELPLQPGIGYLPRNRRLRHLLQEPQRPHRTLPIRNVLRLDLDEGHSWILRRPIVYSVTQIAEPGRGALGVEVFDAGVVVGGRDGGAGDGDPVLGGGILEGNLGGLVGGEVGEFVRVLVR